MALSKSVNYFVNTVCYDSIAMGAFNTNDGEAIQSTLPHRAAKICLKSPKSAKHDVAGITARIDATFENSGIISNRLFAINRSLAEQFKCFKINCKDLFQNKDFNIF